ncbi:Na+/H+ antiporter [Bordetella trematum]|uniref:Na+/H+ antiporter n=1 Tax=Bordetella trematum TaxID=123899 RepID=UPI003989DE3A
MTTVAVIMAMLVAVMLSGVLVRLLPLAIPLPFIQIGLGFLIAAVFQRGVLIEPDIFFLLFLPPLLFLDGWRVSKVAVLRDASSIAQLALGLVFLTVGAVGYLIHWMIPAVPLPVAFAIAAIVSPTDPVALEAISHRVHIPGRMRTILEGEALFNDASGLVAFRIAAAAALTGAFSWAEAIGSFLWLAIAGIVVGMVITWLLMGTRARLTRRFGAEPGSDVLLSLITPFFVYYVAEQIGASGILAAVAAGITMSYAEMSGRLAAATRVERHAVWNLLQFTLNGMMFVLLGEQLPTLIDNLSSAASESGAQHLYWLPVYGLAVCAGLIACRLLWVTVSLKIAALRARRRGRTPIAPHPRLILAMALAGVRGAVTLAGVMTLPFALLDGSPFPARDLAICLAALVILFSLLLACLGLPPLMKGLEVPSSERDRREQATLHRTRLQAALKGVREAAAQFGQASPADAALYRDVAERVSLELRREACAYGDAETSVPPDARDLYIERQLRLQAVAAARQAIYQLARRHQISDSLAREQVMLLDMEEARIRASR